MNQFARSVCPHDCPDTCGLLVKVKKGQVISVRGDPEHPFTRGVVCTKVAHYPQRVYSPQRITRPLRRNGRKGEGRFVPITWDEALEEIKERFNEIISRFGAEAILPYSYAGTMGLVHRQSGHAFFHKLGASRLKRTICSAAAKAGFEISLGDMPSTDIETAVHSDFIIIWGSNTLSTNLHAWRFFSEARRRGAKIVVIDPYENRTARKADRHICLRPGTDAAFALGVMNILIRESLTDPEYIEAHSTGYGAMRERALEYHPEKVAQMSGVSPEEILWLAREFGRAEAPYIRVGWGPSRQAKGGMAIRTIALLPVLVGAFRKQGGGLTWSNSITGHLEMSRHERPDLAPPGVRWVNMVQLGDALTRLTDPPVKALYVYLSNPGVVAPDSGTVSAGLAREDLFTVVHEQFLTETARFADLVLPGTTFLEHGDLYCSYGHYYVQMAYPLIPPVGECRSPLTVFQQLAERFEFREECFAMDEMAIIKQILPSDSPYFKGLTFERLAEGRPLRLNVPVNPFAGGFATPSGKAEMFSRRLEEQGLDPLPDATPSEDREGAGRFPLQMITPTRHHFLNSSFNELEALRKRSGEPTVMIHPEDAGVRGISHGALVRVFNDRGECMLYAHVTRRTSPGVTVVEGLYWPEFTPGRKGVNQLTSQRLGDMGETCAFHCNLVEVSPAHPGSSGRIP